MASELMLRPKEVSCQNLYSLAHFWQQCGDSRTFHCIHLMVLYNWLFIVCWELLGDIVMFFQNRTISNWLNLLLALIWPRVMWLPITNRMLPPSFQCLHQLTDLTKTVPERTHFGFTATRFQTGGFTISSVLSGAWTNAHRLFTQGTSYLFLVVFAAL